MDSRSAAIHDMAAVPPEIVAQPIKIKIDHVLSILAHGQDNMMMMKKKKTKNVKHRDMKKHVPTRWPRENAQHPHQHHRHSSQEKVDADDNDAVIASASQSMHKKKDDLETLALNDPNLRHSIKQPPHSPQPPPHSHHPPHHHYSPRHSRPQPHRKYQQREITSLLYIERNLRVGSGEYVSQKFVCAAGWDRKLFVWLDSNDEEESLPIWVMPNDEDARKIVAMAPPPLLRSLEHPSHEHHDEHHDGNHENDDDAKESARKTKSSIGARYHTDDILCMVYMPPGLIATTGLDGKVCTNYSLYVSREWEPTMVDSSMDVYN
jgi:hypothetical protein